MKLKRATCTEKSFEEAKFLSLSKQLLARVVAADSLIRNVTRSYSLMLSQSDSDLQSLRLHVLHLEELLEESKQNSTTVGLDDDTSYSHGKTSSTSHESLSGRRSGKILTQHDKDVSSLEEESYFISDDYPEKGIEGNIKCKKCLLAKETIVQLRQRCNELKLSLQSSNEEKMEMNLQCQHVAQLQHELSSAQGEFERQVFMLHEQVGRLQGSVFNLEQDIAQKEQVIHDLRCQKTDDIKIELNSLQSKLNDAIKNNNELTEMLSYQVNKLQEKDAIIIEQELALKSANITIQWCHEQCLEASYQEAKIKKKLHKMDRNIAQDSWATKISLAHKEKLSLAKGLQAANTLMIQLKAEMSALKSKHIDLTKQYEEDVAIMKAKLIDANKKLAKCLESTKSESMTKSRTIAQQASNLDASVAEIQVLKKDLENEFHSTNTLKNESSTLKAEVVRLETELNDIRLSLTKEHEVQKQKIEALQLEHVDASQQLAANFNKKLIESEKEKELSIQEYKSQISKIIDEKSKSENNLAMKLEATNHEMMQLKKEMHLLQKKNEELAHEHCEAMLTNKQLVQNLETKISNHNLQLSEVQVSENDELVKAKHENDELCHSITILDYELQAMKKEHDAAAKYQEELMNRNQVLNVLVDDLQLKLEASTDEMKAAELRIEKSRNELSIEVEKITAEYKKKQADMHTSLNELKEVNRKLVESLEISESENEDKSQKICQKSSDLDTAVSSIQDYEKDIDSESHTNSILRNEISSLKGQIMTLQYEIQLLQSKEQEEFQKYPTDAIENEHADALLRIAQIQQKAEKEKEIIVEGYNAQISKLNAEKSKIEDDAAVKLVATNHQMLQVQKELDILQIRNEDLAHEHHETLLTNQQLVQSLETKISDQKLQLSEAQVLAKSELMKAKQKNDELCDNITSLEDELKAMKKEHDAATKYQEELMNKNQELNVLVDDLQLKLEASTDEMKAAELRIEKSRNELSIEVEKLTAEYKKKQADMHKSLNELKEVNRKLIESLEISETENKEKSQKISQKSSDLDTAVTRIQDYERDIDSEHHNSSILRNEISSLKGQIMSLQKEIQSLQAKEQEEFQKYLTDAVEKERADASLRMAQIQQEAEKEKEIIVEGYKAQISKLNAEKSKIEDDTAVKLAAKKHQLLEVQKELDILQIRNEDLARDHHKTLLANQQLVQSFETKISDQKLQLSEAQVLAKSKLMKAKQENDELCDRITSLEEELKAMKKEHDAAAKYQEELMNRNQVLNVLVDDLQLKLEASTDEMKAAELRIEKSRNELSIEVEKITAEYKKKQADMHTSLNELKEVNRKLVESLEISESENKDKSRKISQKSSDLDTAVTRIQDYEKDIDSERHTSSILRNEISSLKGQIVALQNEIQSLQSKEQEEFQKYLTDAVEKERADALLRIAQNQQEAEKEKEIIVEGYKAQISKLNEEKSKIDDDMTILLAATTHQLMQVKEEMGNLQAKHDGIQNLSKEGAKNPLELCKSIKALSDEIYAANKEHQDSAKKVQNQTIKKEEELTATAHFLQERLEVEIDKIKTNEMQLETMQHALKTTSRELECTKMLLHEEKQKQQKMESESTLVNKELQSAQRAQRAAENKNERLHRYIENLLKVIMDNKPDLLDCVQTST